MNFSSAYITNRKTKRNFSIFLLLQLVFLFSRGQIGPATTGSGNPWALANYTYGNEWYDPAREYHKLVLTTDGIYRVTGAQLVNANIDTSGTSPLNLHVIYRGEEQRIFVRDSAGILIYFEFWGRRNDGRVDSLMYRNHQTCKFEPDGVTNVHTSLFTDSSAYFFYWDNTPGLRFNLFSDTVNYGSYTPEPWFRYEALKDYVGPPYQQGGADPHEQRVFLSSNYVPGEGYPGPGFDESAWFEEVFFPTPGFAASGNPSELHSRLYSNTSVNDHVRKILINNVEIARDTVDAYVLKTLSGTDPNPYGPWIFIKYWVDPGSAGVHGSRVAWFILRYDRLFDLAGGNEMRVVDYDKASSAYLQFTNTTGTSACVMYDLTTGTRIEGSFTAGESRFIVPGSSIQNRVLVMATDAGVKTPLVYETTRLRNLKNKLQGADFILITHRDLAVSAQEYVSYRDTVSVNDQTAMLVYTDEIYDEFGYGSHTPLAIKRFCKYALHNWQVRPKNFLLWGKARGYHRFTSNDDLVPTWGLPASDVHYVTEFYDSSMRLVPEAGIGRVSIGDNDQGRNYLDKVKLYESQPHEAWMKDVLLMAGGAQEANYIGETMTDSLSSWSTRLQGQPFGANVYWFRKTLNGAVYSNTTNSSYNIISNGVSLIHFFGHSSQSAFDLDILDPGQYGNEGKFPLMLAFGCNGGDFTQPGGSFGERFISEPNKGSIGYFANSSLGFTPYLKQFGDKFYQVATGTHYGLPLGVQLRECYRQYEAMSIDSLTDHHRINHAHQLNLQGDPSLVLNFPQLPDLWLTSSDLYLSPSGFSAQDNQFSLNIIVHNSGRVPLDSFTVSVRHFTPAGNIVQYPPMRFPAFAYSDTIELNYLNQLGPAMAGENEFEVWIDSDEEIDEYYEDNNRATLRVLIPGNSPAVLFPTEYAIVPNATVFLAASAVVMTSIPSLPYIFEIDTVPGFTSNWKISSGVVNGTPVYCQWAVPDSLQDSVIYYWRVRLENVMPPVWTTSSFRHINGVTGWSQAAPPQFFKDLTDGVRMNTVNRIWEFTNETLPLHVSINQAGLPSYTLGEFGSNLSEGPGGVKYTPIRAANLVPAIQGTLYRDWALLTMPDGQTELVNAISNTPPGDWFLMTSNYDPMLHTWNAPTFQALNQIGVNATDFAALPAGTHFIVLGKKGGAPGSAIVISQPNVTLSGGALVYDLLVDLFYQNTEGTIHSTRIGPALTWNQLEVQWNTLDVLPGDSLTVDVYGIRADNSETLLFSGLQEGIHSLASVNADDFMRMRLTANVKDEQYRTAPQLHEWVVLYEAAPDAAIDPTVNFAFHNDTVMEGETVSIHLAARNLSATGMDSLLVAFSLERADRTRLMLDSIRIAPLSPDSVVEFDFSFSTGYKNLRGDVVLTTEINPGMEQPEIYSFNNVFYQRFHVLADKVNPLLDVTFNGKHIMEGDIVSSDPEIRIELNDENEFLQVPIDDTTFVVYFGAGRSLLLLDRITVFNNPLVEHVPAQLPANRSSIIFRPGQLADGEYTLRVMGRDWSDNASGQRDYLVHFNVVNEKTVSHVLNYPNPFSSSTRFVYTLTGNEMPRQFEIRIFTVSGKLVKVIDLLEEGEVNFGHNVTRYAWDGTDDFGDALANGVYIYQVVTRFSDGEAKIRDEGTGQYFKNGFGKMYLMR